ncbi:MAG: ABC transporter permease, partial [Clostridia bacterium]|nr:ABC transporter permease [Clostridia bacterium]
MLNAKRKRLETAADIRLKSQIGEEERFWDLMRRMARENRTAVISFILIVLMALAAIFAPLLTPYTETDMDLLNRLAPPSAAHLLGTDEGGRDVLTRLLFGARVSLLIGVVPALLSLILGAVLGVISGYRGGIWDAIIMRVADVTLAFPSMLLAMVIMYSLG